MIRFPDTNTMVPHLGQRQAALDLVHAVLEALRAQAQALLGNGHKPPHHAGPLLRCLCCLQTGQQGCPLLPSTRVFRVQGFGGRVRSGV